MPHLEFENAILQKFNHFNHIAGIDEAGRGALAGPVVAAAVILPLNLPQKIAHLNKVNDSKKLSAKNREKLFDLIQEHALAHAVGVVSAQIIDEVGIVPATKLAMKAAVSQLNPKADYLLIDGRIKLPQVNLPQQSIIRGDGRSLSIAAASIMAKVSRDRLMTDLSPNFPHYHFARHKGYGTQIHREAIGTHGPCKIHRFTFAPIRQKS